MVQSKGDGDDAGEGESEDEGEDAHEGEGEGGGEAGCDNWFASSAAAMYSASRL